MGYNIFTKMHSKAINSTPSHLSSFDINVSFGIFLRGASLSLTLGSFIDARGFTLGSSHRVVTIT
jgi:hypothetical protein